jgi:hypothetical protein
MRNASLLIAPCELWDREPNMVLWEDPTTRLACLALRNTPDGDERVYWRGYVGVPETHPAFKAPWDDGLIDSLDVHGGVTYAGPDPLLDRKQSDTWWLGFDCAYGLECRDLRYVVGQCAHLARQLWESAPA